MRKKDCLAAVHAALQKLDEVGTEEAAIAVLCHSLSGDGPRPPEDIYAEVRWRSSDVDRKRTAALTALKKALKPGLRELPIDALHWLRGESPAPCYVPSAAREELCALVREAQPERSLFDEFDDVEVV